MLSLHLINQPQKESDVQDHPTQNELIEAANNVNVDFERHSNVDTTVVKEEPVTTITCSNCQIILELTDDILHEMIVSNSQRFEQLMLNKVREHLDTLQKESKSKGIQCEIIGQTSDSTDSK